MSKDKLVVTGNGGNGYRITWDLAESGEYGCSLGESADDGTGELPRENGDREAWVVCKAVLELKPARDKDGWFWEKRREADAALKVAKTALKEERTRQKQAGESAR